MVVDNSLTRPLAVVTGASNGIGDDPAEVAKQGFEALMAGKDSIIAGSLATKIQGTASQILPDTVSAEMHRQLTEAGSAKN